MRSSGVKMKMPGAVFLLASAGARRVAGAMLAAACVLACAATPRADEGGAGTAEEILERNRALEHLAPGELEPLIAELGHAEWAHREAALDRAKKLDLESMTALIGALRLSRDPELVEVLRVLLPIHEGRSSVPPGTLRTLAAAAAGDAYAQGVLGAMFWRGEGGLTVNIGEALRWSTLSADQGNPMGLYCLAHLHNGGKGVERDATRADGLWSNCVAGMRRLAEEGDPVAQCNMGWMCEAGKGVPADSDKALLWYRLGATQGYARAQCTLGSKYRAATNWPAALKLYRASAKKGYATAQLRIAQMYTLGQGVESNLVAAVEWARRAANQGCAEAQFKLGWMTAQGQGMRKDLAAAAEWYRRAAAKGHSSARNNLGYAYDRGLGVPRDRVMAVELYRQAAEAGNLSAAYNMACAYYCGTGVPTDLTESSRWQPGRSLRPKGL